MDRNICRVISIAVALHALSSSVGALPEHPHSYVWLGELVLYDARGKTVTLKAPYREHINRYIGEFKRGDKVQLTWATPRPGETDAIIYVGRDEAGSAKWGYVLTVEFVSADMANQRLTFTMAVPPQAIKTLQTVPLGRWIKVTTPFDQRHATADTIERVEVAAGANTPSTEP
jgi:hypothetical protein